VDKRLNRHHKIQNSSVFKERSKKGSMSPSWGMGLWVFSRSFPEGKVTLGEFPVLYSDSSPQNLQILEVGAGRDLDPVPSLSKGNKVPRGVVNFSRPRVQFERS
jgi:hypothetical protein